jgi:hypothetical protein
VEGSVGKRFLGREKQQIAGIGQQKALPLPKLGSPGHAPIEFVLRFRLRKPIASKALFIEKVGYGILLFPLRGTACRGNPRLCCGLADVV